METAEKAAAAFERLQQVYSQARTKAVTGDPSLDALLLIVEPKLAKLIQDLAVPHWFDVEMAVALAGAGQAETARAQLEQIRKLVAVKTNPRGFAYHDLMREGLHNYLIRTEPGRVREVSRVLAGVLDQPADGVIDEVRWEQVYLRIASDEQAGLEQFDELFRTARDERRFNVCNTLAQMIEEHRPLVSPTGVMWLDYYQAMLAFDQHRWAESRDRFAELSRHKLPEELEYRVGMYRARTFAAMGQWKNAEKVYKERIKAIGKHPDPYRGARLHQLLAETLLALGKLSLAETHARRSREFNEASGDPIGQALNLGTLGTIYGRFRDVVRAEASFNNGLDLLDRAGRIFSKIKLYRDWGEINMVLSREEQAEACYQAALKIASDAGDNYTVAQLYAHLGKVQLAKGNRQTALDHFRTSLDQLRAFRDRLSCADILKDMAAVFERGGDLAAAREHMRLALQELSEEMPTQTRTLYHEEDRRLERIAEHTLHPQSRRGRLKIAGLVVLGIALLILVGFLVVRAL